MPRLLSPLVVSMLLAAPAVAQAAPASSPIGIKSPDDLYGPLFRAVELARVFPDSKTFADMVPVDTPDSVMAAYRAERPQGRDGLTAFVARHFTTAGARANGTLPLRAHIRALWPILSKPPIAADPGGSALPLPSAYVVPGGRYQEFYYWDTYFTMLGLKADGQDAMIEAMLDNFVSLVERYGHVPNGTRTYYLSRSQPPFLALMMDLSPVRDRAVLMRRLAALTAEHDYWMAGAGCVDAGGACQHVVRMPDGSLLNRYWDARDTPRDESYAEDVATAAAANRPADRVNRDLRAAAESGWDFSSRWLTDGRTLSGIHTTDIVPVDLNALLWAQERAIARRAASLGAGDVAARYEGLAARRRTAIDRYLWSAAEGRYVDWDRARGAPTPVASAAMVVPLFVGLASPAQGEATARLVEARMLAPGGLRTTQARNGQQWDEPNGWAPLQWMAVDGLDRYGAHALARTIASRWLDTVNRLYCATGRVIEKYDVETQGVGGGGEYVVQDGFGWTNGSVSAMIGRYGMEVKACVPQGGRRVTR